jgi:endonuclease/exonuclease/phosphatase (EEP) superfamily protein YafD
MVGSKRISLKIILSVLKIIIQLINVAVIIVLLAIHFVIKEQTFWSSLYFYAFPLPVIIFVVLTISIILTKKWRRYNLIIATVLLVIWLSRSFKIHIPDTIKETDLEVVFWNASRENTFESVIHENKDIPDVMVLVEFRKNNIEELKKRFPEYYFYKSERELFIFSKTPCDSIVEKTSNYNTTVINFKTAGINFYAVDATGSPDVPKEWGLTYINQQIKEKKSIIVLGDFNTPYESKHLKQFKTDFNHAFNNKGNGFRETWFYNIPLLSLDHIWVSKDLKILKTQKIYTTKSDHSILKTFVRK